MYARMTIIKNIDHQTYCANHIMMDVNQRIQCHRSILSPKYWKNKKIKFRKHLFFSLGGKKKMSSNAGEVVEQTRILL